MPWYLGTMFHTKHCDALVTNRRHSPAAQHPRDSDHIRYFPLTASQHDVLQPQSSSDIGSERKYGAGTCLASHDRCCNCVALIPMTADRSVSIMGRELT